MKKIQILAMAFAAIALFGACKQKAEAPAEPVNTDNIYQFEVLDTNLDTVNMADYQGKVLLVVNTATHCGFTPQYEALEALYQKYRAQGFEILDFPCNQFGEQAPGTNQEINDFCTGTYNTTFPRFAKIDVNGDNPAPIYAWLISKAPFEGIDTTDEMGVRLDRMFRSMDSLYDQKPDVKWNFTKFLIDREGNVVARFEPYEGYAALQPAIEKLLQ